LTFPNIITLAGDIIYVNRGLYKHYGVYAGNGRVIHFASYSGTEISAENAVVHETTLEAFLKGGTLQIERGGWGGFSRRKTVERARACIGKKEYNLAFNNCEQFARWCKTGTSRSIQVENAIEKVAGLVSDILDR
jgi:hypothetical protein